VPWGIEKKKISDRLVNVPTTYFGESPLLLASSSMTDKWYREYSSYVPTMSKDGVIKITGHSVYKNAVSSGRYIKVPMSDDPTKEVMVQFILVCKGTAGLGFGVGTGLGAHSTNAGFTGVIGMYGNRLHATISTAGTPNVNCSIATESGCVRKYYGDSIPGFTNTNWTAFVLKCYFIRGLDDDGENKQTYARAELFINGQPGDFIETEITDETNDVFGMFAAELRPFIHVYQNTSVWVKHVGVYR
jgi:hypothetical protein